MDCDHRRLAIFFNQDSYWLTHGAWERVDRLLLVWCGFESRHAPKLYNMIGKIILMLIGIGLVVIGTVYDTGPSILGVTVRFIGGFIFGYNLYAFVQEIKSKKI